MIFFVGNDGTIIKSFPEYVYQGSANTNTIYLIAPFAVNSQVTVAFQLPNGTWTSPVAMTQQQALQNIVNKETGQTYAGWTYALPNNITQNFGVLTVQFFFYSASAGVITATSSAKLTVAKGVPSVLPETPSEDVYEAILSNIAALQAQLNNGTFVARSIYAWNSTYTYGANEITFYPSIGDYGAFVQSLQTGNTNHQPYDSDGTLNSTWWKEVVNFNTITEDFFGEIKEQAELTTTAAQNAATSEARAAQSASAAASSESAAETAATTATGAAASAEKDAETASTSANAAAASANASAASASQANNSAIAANNSAIAAANSAAQIENMKTTFALKDESASSLEVSLNNATFVLTMTLKDVNGNTLSKQTVDFPIESMVVGISYNEATKTLIFQLQSGSTIEVPIDDIVDGLASQTALDNVINGTTPVAKATAADTAGQVDNALTVVTDGVPRQYNGSAPVTVTINTTSSTDPESVHFTSQTLNDSQQTQARENIGAASVAEMNAGDDKSYYNLGAYDTYVDNGDGTVTVTRKTGKIDGDNYRFKANAQSGRVYYQYNETVSSENDITLEGVQFTRVNSTDWWNESLDANTTYVSYDNSSRQIVILPAQGVTPNNYTVIYKTFTDYTETLPANVPINTLDANMSNIVRDEVEKTLNLLNQTENPRVFTFQIDLGIVHLKPNTTYYLKGYGWTVTNAQIRVTTTDLDVNTTIESYYNSFDYNLTNGGSFTTSSSLEENDYGLVLRGTFVVDNIVIGTVMLNEGSHAYPYQPYNGAIVHEKQLNNALEGYLPLAGGALTGNLNMGTNDIEFRGSDPGDIVFRDEDNTEMGRIYGGGALNIRSKSDGSGIINMQGLIYENGQRVYSPNNKPTKSDIGLGNVDNVQQYSSQNPPPYPVTSVDGKTGAVQLSEVGVVKRDLLWSGNQNISSGSLDISLESTEYTHFIIDLDSTDWEGVHRSVVLPATYSIGDPMAADIITFPQSSSPTGEIIPAVYAYQVNAFVVRSELTITQIEARKIAGSVTEESEGNIYILKVYGIR